MYIGNMLGDLSVAFVVRRVTEERLRTKCFRGTSLPLAGNFSRWNSAEQLLQDELVKKEFLADIHELWLAQDFTTHSLTIIHEEIAGWESTAPLKNYSPHDLEQFNLNRKAQCLRVKPSRVELLAPKTRQLTLIFEFKAENDAPVAVVHSIYPGCDVGELYGDVTAREKRVFFDWNHPGET